MYFEAGSTRKINVNLVLFDFGVNCNFYWSIVLLSEVLVVN